MTHPTTDALYDAIGLGITVDDDGTLLSWLDGPGSLLGEVDDVVRDSDSGPGWAAELTSADSHRPRWTAQLLGVQVPGNADEQMVRDLIVARPGFRRGTVTALVGTAQTLLTGSKYVGVKERDGSAYRVTVTTYTTETPDPAAVNAALQAAKPAGLLLTHVVTPPTSYTALEAMAALTYTALEAQTALSYTDYETGA